MPAKLAFLFEPARYKVTYGGRGSGKSWGFADALLLQAAQSPLRVLCAREVQKSIKDSVHRLLTDRIQKLGLGAFFEVLDTEIRGRNGSLFLFAGLATHTVESIKSLEGIDRVWVEEAQTVSKKSWDVLIPTIRKPGSEIWITFNPDLDTDETWVRFVENAPPGSVVVEMNYEDNPWFPDELEAERLHCKLVDPVGYETTWAGKCRAALQGAIYADEVLQAQLAGRIRNVPHDPALPVHTVWDLGWNDKMSIILAQRVASEVRVIDYISESFKTLDWYVSELESRRWKFGTDFLPHDGGSRDFKTGKSTQELLINMGRTVQLIPRLEIEHGIRAARMLFPRVYFDKEKTADLQQCLKRYRRTINSQTGEAGAPLHDEWSHGADAFRYLAVCAEQMHNHSKIKETRQYGDNYAGY